MEAKLDPGDFVRIHRSAIVRIEAVREFHPNPAGEAEVILSDGSRLTASRRYQKNLQTALKTQTNGH
jgi:two-component system LytT family response regulator